MWKGKDVRWKDRWPNICGITFRFGFIWDPRIQMWTRVHPSMKAKMGTRPVSLKHVDLSRDSEVWDLWRVNRVGMPACVVLDTMRKPHKARRGRLGGAQAPKSTWKVSLDLVVASSMPHRDPSWCRPAFVIVWQCHMGQVGATWMQHGISLLMWFFMIV